MGRKADLIDKVFGMLTVIRENGRDIRENVLWECLCDCGKTSFVPSGHLISGNTKSCGCVHGDKHGHSKGGVETPTYKTWRHMKERCANPNCKDYPDYGGRGITIHPTWVNSFPTFLTDVGERPSKEYSIDRIDCNGNYEPGNVRWATDKEQNNNQRNTCYLTCKGLRLPLTTWSERTSISTTTLWSRKNRGWSDLKTLTTPVRKMSKRK